MTMQNPYSGETMNVMFQTSKYTYNGRPYIGLMSFDEEFEFWEPWCDVTVNLADATPDEGCVFIDTNNAPYIAGWLQEQKIGTPTGRFAPSGWCLYPEFRIDFDLVEQNKLPEM